jgi:hypothetical protein
MHVSVISQSPMLLASMVVEAILLLLFSYADSAYAARRSMLCVHPTSMPLR